MWSRIAVPKMGLSNIILPVEMIKGTELSEDIKAELKRPIEQAQSEYDVQIDKIFIYF